MSQETAPTILVVEDDFSMRELLRKVLEKNDYHVVEAEDGTQALLRLEQTPEISLVLTDIKMPGKDGMDLLQEVAKMSSQIKVILITAFGEVEQYLDAMNLGAFEYLNKPFRNQQLLDIIKRALQAR